MAYRNITAADLPRLMTSDDGRGQVVDLRQFVKDWAHETPEGRARMVAAAPRRFRWYHRFNARRGDLARIAAVAHALCDRDRVEVPSWVWRHRSRRHIMMGGQRATNTAWTRLVQVEAPAACAYHRVWFGPASIEDHRVHGFRDHPTIQE